MNVTANNRSLGAIIASAAASWAVGKWGRIVRKRWREMWPFRMIPVDVLDRIGGKVDDQVDEIEDAMGG